MKGKRQGPHDAPADRQRRAGDLIHRLVARLDSPASPPTAPAVQPRPAMADAPKARANAPEQKKEAGPTPVPAGRRSGEGASSVLPYLSQTLQSKPGDSER